MAGHMGCSQKERPGFSETLAAWDQHLAATFPDQRKTPSHFFASYVLRQEVATLEGVPLNPNSSAGRSKSQRVVEAQSTTGLFPL